MRAEARPACFVLPWRSEASLKVAKPTYRPAISSSLGTSSRLADQCEDLLTLDLPST